jgi:hypothetical protein
MAVGSVGNCVVQTSSYPRGCGQVRRPFDDLSKGGVVRLWAARPIVLAVHSLSIPPASPGTVHSLLLGGMPSEIATLGGNIVIGPHRPLTKTSEVTYHDNQSYQEVAQTERPEDLQHHFQRTVQAAGLVSQTL